MWTGQRTSKNWLNINVSIERQSSCILKSVTLYRDHQNQICRSQEATHVIEPDLWCEDFRPTNLQCDKEMKWHASHQHWHGNLPNQLWGSKQTTCLLRMGMANWCAHPLAYQLNVSPTTSSLTPPTCCRHPESISHTWVDHQLERSNHVNMPFLQGNIGIYAAWSKRKSDFNSF